MYLLLQEVEVWYIIPMLRKLLAKHLIQEYGYSYEKTGKILGVSKSAISQYMNNKRANKIKLSNPILEEIKASSERISEDNNVVIREIQVILKHMRESKSSCDVCKQFNSDILKYCNKNPNY